MFPIIADKTKTKTGEQDSMHDGGFTMLVQEVIQLFPIIPTRQKTKTGQQNSVHDGGFTMLVQEVIQYIFRFIFDNFHPPPLLLLLDLHGLWKSLIMEADRRYVSHNSRQDKNKNRRAR